MKNKLLFRIILSLFLSNGQFASAQETKIIIPPLYSYLQNNADSTVILTYEKDPMIPVRHFILSKNSNMITLYLYESPYNRSTRDLIPKNIRSFFQKRDLEMNNMNVDTNSYFNAVHSNPKKTQNLWRKTMSFSPWKMTDDAIEGEGCNKLNKNNDTEIYDGGGITLYLITNKQIKRLHFYAPEFYAKKCPKEKTGRSLILKLEQLFKKYYNKD